MNKAMLKNKKIDRMEINLNDFEKAIKKLVEGCRLNNIKTLNLDRNNLLGFLQFELKIKMENK